MPSSTFIEIPTEEQRDAGRAAARAVRLPTVLAHLVVVRGWTHPDRHCRGPVLLALQRVPHRASLSRKAPSGLVVRQRWAAHSADAPHRTARRVAAIAGRSAQGSPAAYGWCRVRWSCATPALSRQATRGITSPPIPCDARSTRSPRCGSAPCW